MAGGKADEKTDQRMNALQSPTFSEFLFLRMANKKMSCVSHKAVNRDD